MRGILSLALVVALANVAPAVALHRRGWFSFINPTPPAQRTASIAEQYNNVWKLPDNATPLTGGRPQLCYSRFSWRSSDYRTSAKQALESDSDLVQRCLPRLAQFPSNVQAYIGKYALQIFESLLKLPPVDEETTNAIERRAAYDRLHADTYKSSNHLALYISDNQIVVQAINLVTMPAYLGTNIVVLSTLPKNAHCISYENKDEYMHAAMEYFARVFTDGFNGLPSEDRSDFLNRKFYAH